MYVIFDNVLQISHRHIDSVKVLVCISSQILCTVTHRLHVWLGVKWM